ncbi:MAG TPA: tyrosine-type recombinase/integrase [Nocardioides sp.]|uniref:tyrosine-type recombinase/integrase n=1 Tax=Nocardioides sp. TaxID=35761 RepID=UPI002D087FE1|nr:tyrosine-type recombinase/integrase [Nocardioides sp.]HTW15147.1 tyrosine-type recombinase/integrase [Nocardioides sp.]
MGTIASIKRRESGKWRARYRDAAGKEHAKHFDRKIDGQQWLDQVTASVVRGDYVDPKAGRATLASYAASWEQVQVSSDGTKRIVDNALRLHILPELGKHPLSAIRPTMVQALVKKLDTEKGLSPGTIHGIYHVLTQVLDAAVDDRLISSSPCTSKIKLPQSDDAPVVPPTIERVEAFRDALPERYRALAVLLAGAGPRIGEALGLDKHDVTFLGKGAVKIDEQRRQDGTIGPLKSKKSRRVVPIGKVVVETLAAHLKAYPSEGALFLDEIGEPLVYRRWRTVAEAAVVEANRREAAALRERDPKATYTPWDLTAHDLRHFYASALIAGGASVKQVQERLGHATPVITLTTYAHLWPGEDDRTREVMDEVLSPLADSPRTAEALDA